MWIVGRLEVDGLVEGLVETEVESLAEGRVEKWVEGLEEGLVGVLQEIEMPFFTREVTVLEYGLWEFM